MYKYMLIFVALNLLVGSAGAMLVSHDETTHTTLEKNVMFSQPQAHIQDLYMLLTVDNANSWVKQPGKPQLPAYQETFMLPFNSRIDSIDVQLFGKTTRSLSYKIMPASQPQPLIQKNVADEELYQEDQSAYSSSEMYPTEPYSYSLGVGRHNSQRMLFVTITCNFVQYAPALNLLSSYDQVKMTIQYHPPQEKPSSYDETYDMVIITPEEFQEQLQPLVDHKNQYGVETTVKTTEDIYAEYQGRDKPEQIKYFIKDALETWNISYVLLVGGMKSIIHADPRDDANQGTNGWLLPVRYTNLYDGGGVQDPGYISDLYYADIYKIEDNETVFDTWDSNEDNIFAFWKMFGEKDVIDMWPDVYIGRLACRNKFEVNIMVNKIITYETSTYDEEWFNTMVVIGGDTFDDVSTTNYYEGEVETQKQLDYMSGFEPVKIWCSNRESDGLVPVPRDIIKTVSQGCGFLSFAGHGSPERWNTYWCEDFESDRAKGLWYYNMPFFRNKGKYPVCVIGGCHNSQFNVTALGFLFGTPWVYGPCPESFSWLLARNINGGAIATLGNTGLGYGTVGNSGDLDGDGEDEPDCIEALGGYLETQFFKAYGVDGITVLGDTWGAAIENYLSVYPAMSDKIDCKTVQQWVLLGDPSLQIGGYAQ